MPPRQRPSAQLSVIGKRFLLIDFAYAAQSAILQRSKVELSARAVVLGMAEKDIAGGFHHPLPFNHATPLMPFIPQLAAEALQHGLLRLLKLQEKRFVISAQEK